MSGHQSLIMLSGRCMPLLQSTRSIVVTGPAINDPGIVIGMAVDLAHYLTLFGNGFANSPTQSILLPNWLPGGFTEESASPTTPCSSAWWATRMTSSTAVSSNYGSFPLNTWVSLSDAGGGGAGPFEWAWERTTTGTTTITATLAIGSNAARVPIVQTVYNITINAT